MTTGRPTFQIDQDRLHGLRQEAGLTQAEVAKRAYEHLKKPRAGAETAMKNYQKIERTGRTSKAMAQALAEVLETTVAVLQGEAPDDVMDSVDRVERQLRDQVAADTNPVLRVALERDPEAENPVRELAANIAAWIEAAQIGQHPQELARLTELTGWTEKQLMQPASIHGYWLLLSRMRGSGTTEIVLGASDVRYRIEQAAAKFAGYLEAESDATITLREALPWMHVDIQNPRIPSRRCTFSFVRCRPHAIGLQWVNPTWRDRFWLDEPLLSWAFTNANFVTGFDGQSWPRDVRRLRLLVEEYGESETLRPVALIKGNLDELPEDVLRNFQAEGVSHCLATNWIVTGIWQDLEPYLGSWPSSCWKIHTGACCINLVLDVPRRLATARGGQPCFTTKFRIRLVEEDDQGEIQPVPWRSSSVAKVSQLMQKRLDEELEGERPADGRPSAALATSEA